MIATGINILMGILAVGLVVGVVLLGVALCIKPPESDDRK